MRGKTVCDIMLVILEFKRLCVFYTFGKDEQNFENKSLINGIKVKIGISYTDTVLVDTSADISVKLMPTNVL